jgi:hypothetical protein
LADLDVYGGKDCPVCAKTAAIDHDEIRRKLTTLLVRQSVAATEATERLIEERAEEIAQERLEALKAERAIG